MKVIYAESTDLSVPVAVSDSGRVAERQLPEAWHWITAQSRNIVYKGILEKKAWNQN